MRLQLIYSFPYQNCFSNIAFDKNNTGYFFASGDVVNNEIVNSKVFSIDSNNETQLLTIVDGVINYKTFKINDVLLFFGICAQKSHKLCAYYLNGTFAWEIPFDDTILEVNCIPNGNVVVTTYAGNTKKLTWLDTNGSVINSCTAVIRFANLIINNNCIFIHTDDKMVICDFDGNIKKTVSIGHTTFSMWKNRNNAKNETVSLVVTSRNSIFTIDQNGSFVNEYSLTMTKGSNMFNELNLYGINCYSDNVFYVMQNGWLSSKLLKVDVTSNSIVAEFNSNNKFLNTPIVTEDEKIIALMNNGRNTASCVVFDNKFDELERIKLRGEAFEFAVNNDRIYVFTLNKKLNEVELFLID